MKVKNKSLLTYLSIFFLVLSILSGCSLIPSSKKTTPEDFDAFTEELFRNELSQNTLNLHYTLAYPKNYGIEDYDVSLGSFEMSDIYDYSELEELEKTLKDFSYDDLTDEQQLTYDILNDYIETENTVKDLPLYGELLNPLTGYQSQLPVLLAEYTFRTKEDIENYLTLTASIEESFHSIIEYEKARSEAGLFMPDYAAEAIIEQCSTFIEDPENNYMIEVFNDKIDAFSGLSDTERNDYKERNHTIITTNIVNAYRSLIDSLTELKGSGVNEGGLCNFKDGKRYYEYLVKNATGSSKSIKNLQKMTERYIDNCINEMISIAALNPNVLDDIATYSFDLTEPNDILEDLISKISIDFPEPPKVNYTVKYVHESMEESLSPAFYLTPPIDDPSQNVIYINNGSVSDDLYTTLAHEGYPGHLYQTVYTNSSDLPLIRNLFSSPGYTEGWATYVEYYAFGISGLEKNLAQTLSLNGSASLGLYAYVDMAVNYDGWDRTDVEEFFAGYGIEDKEATDFIYEAMVEDPANYLSYFIGYLEILELKDKAQKTLGDKFVLKDFHDFFLTIGPAPFSIIEKEMNIWMDTILK
ncbi:MAG: DUF885 domain-containing protein [Lachnospiraceae bacterium]|jgi:uncharacterized protein (DUF885 family)|nr:DUF885 domain-containing protein [Lachnospiraceae bacterium]